MFNLKKVTELEDYNGKGYLYVHDKTGMEIFHLKNDNPELACCFMFATPSQDSMGVAHILEHTVLNGSGLYPVKDPFTEIYSSSPNTFQNALTFTDKTVYPFASPLKKDFDILFSIYADAVFNPLLRKESFEQEGVRFFEDKFDGVVYNEMTGALSDEDSILQETCLRKLYEGTAAQYVSGGDPVFIADLTYEEYKARYRKWYSPSNCRLFMFGDLDIREYMNILEERYLFENNLSKWENVKIVANSSAYPPIHENETVLDQYCACEDASSVVMSWLTKPAEDPLDVLTLTMLADILMGAPGSPLYDAIVASDLGDDMSPASGVDSDFPLMPFIIGFTGAKKNSEEKIRMFILNELKKIVEKGLPKDLVEGVIRRQEFKIQEIPDTGLPIGLSAAFKSAKLWMRGLEPDTNLLNSEILAELRRRVEEGPYFEKWIEENLLNNTRRCLVSMKYDPQYNSRKNAILEEKLAKRKSLVSKEQFNADRENFNRFVNAEDSPEMLAAIPRVTVEDLPEKIPQFTVEDKPFNGIRLIELPEFTNGITYMENAFPIDDLTYEELEKLPLLIRLLQMCGTKKVSFTQVSMNFKLLTGAFTIQPVFGTASDGNSKGFVYLKIKALNRYFGEALKLLSDVLTKPDFKKERIEASITDILTDFESSFHESANYFAYLRAASKLSDTFRKRELTVGTESYLNTKALEGKNIAKSLESLLHKVFSKNNLIAQISCDPAFMEEAKAKLSVYSDSFPEKKEDAEAGEIGKAGDLKKTDVILTSSGPAYNVRVFKPDFESEEEKVAASALSGALGNGYLWNTIRGLNGAYGAFCQTDLQENLVMMGSYRDPKVKETFEIYEHAAEKDVSQDEIDHLTVTVIGKELKPMAPQAKSQETFRRHLYGMTDLLYLKRRKTMLSVKPEHLKKVGIMVSKAVFSDATICGKEMTGLLDGMNKEVTELQI